MNIGLITKYAGWTLYMSQYTATTQQATRSTDNERHSDIVVNENENKNENGSLSKNYIRLFLNMLCQLALKSIKIINSEGIS